MKIVMLNGQNHRGSSYHIGRAVIDRIEGEKEVTEFFFPKDLDHFCLGCYRCIEDAAACPFYEEKKVILDAIDGADLLVVTTPTYCMHVSAPLKAFIDLTFDLWMSRHELGRGRPQKEGEDRKGRRPHRKAAFHRQSAGRGHPDPVPVSDDGHAPEEGLELLARGDRLLERKRLAGREEALGWAVTPRGGRFFVWQFCRIISIGGGI